MTPSLRVLALSAALLAVSSLPAHADYWKLYAPHAEEGEASVETDLNYSADHRAAQNTYFSQVYGFEYGVTDHWMTEIGGEFEDANHDSNHLTHWKWENVIAPWKPNENWIDTGFYFEVEKAVHSDDPYNFEGKLLLKKTRGDWDHLLNIGLNHEFGSHADGTGASLAWSSNYKVTDMFRPGIEYYADIAHTSRAGSFNEQGHRIGPVVYGKIGEVSYDTGVLFGVSSAADDAILKFNLEWEF